MLPYFTTFGGDGFEPTSPLLPLQQLDYYQIYSRAGNRSIESENNKLDSAILVQDFDLPDNAIHADLLGWAIANSGEIKKTVNYSLTGSIYSVSP